MQYGTIAGPAPDNPGVWPQSPAGGGGGWRVEGQYSTTTDIDRARGPGSTCPIKKVTLSDWTGLHQRGEDGGQVREQTLRWLLAPVVPLDRANNLHCIANLPSDNVILDIKQCHSPQVGMKPT